MSQAIFITGGAGFIGSNFVRFLRNEGVAPLVIIDNFRGGGLHETLSDITHDEKVTIVRADISDTPTMLKLLEAHHPKTIVNFAAETHVDRSITAPATFIQSNIIGTFSLLEALRTYNERTTTGATTQHRPQIRFLQVSTDEVYGSLGAVGAFTETSQIQPNSPYAASKASADHLVRAYFKTYGLDTITTHCSNNFGPYQLPEKLVPLTILNALEGRELPIYGNGQQVRDWMYVEDHCVGIWRALCTGRVGEEYNFGANCERSTVAMVSQICNMLEEVIPAANNQAMITRGLRSYLDLKRFVADRPGHDQRYALDTSKAKRELDWTAKVSFDDAIRRTIEWYLAHNAWTELAQETVRKRLKITDSLAVQFDQSSEGMHK